MPVTIMGPGSVGLPKTLAPYFVDTKGSWEGDWTFRPELEVIGGEVASGGQDLGRLEFRRKYGRIKQPWESTTSDVTPLDLKSPLPHWVRLRTIDDQGFITLFVGNVADETRRPYGPSPVRSGLQVFTAYGPLWSLMQARVDGSWWQVAGEAVFVDWIPDVNRRDRPTLRHAGVLSGNRSATWDSEKLTYLFGGKSIWTHLQFLEYLLAWHVSGNGFTAPLWNIGGQVDLLVDLTEPIDLRGVETMASLLRRIIRPDRGMDYCIVPRGDDLGFEIKVFSLAGEESSFGGFTLPANPDEVRLEVGNQTDIARSTIVDAEEQRYYRIVVRGERMVVAETGKCACGSLVKKWTAAQETAYKAGTGNGDDLGEEHDTAREAEWLKPVYAAFGFPSGTLPQCPVLDDDGALRVGQWQTGQSGVRETMSYVPMFDGQDYRTSPPTPTNTAAEDPKLQAPNAWLYDEDDERYVSAENAQVSVSVARSDWGILLGSSPNHRLALNRFDGAADTDTDPVYDYTHVVATFAFRTDYRLQVRYQEPFALDTDPVMIIEAPEAEFWYLKAGTVIDLGPDGTFRVAAEQVTRNDVDALQALMAAAVARYARPRGRAELVFHGFLPWTDLLGQVISLIDEGGEMHNIQAPITSIHWMFPEMHPGDPSPPMPQTVVRAGHATG